MKKFFKESLRIIIVISVLFGVVTLVSAWTAPTQAPPGGNVPAPVNVGTATQNLLGTKTIGYTNSTDFLYINPGLSVNGAFRAFSQAVFGGTGFGSSDKVYIGTDGKVGVGVSSPSQSLDALGYVKGRSGLCIGNDCKSAWPSGGGGYKLSDNPPLNNTSLGSWIVEGNHTYSDKDLGSTDELFFCALTGQYVAVSAEKANSMECILYINNNRWILRAGGYGACQDSCPIAKCDVICLEKI